MVFVSYAQNFEDVMLWRALKHVENGFYIDIGAAWNEEHSVKKLFMTTVGAASMLSQIQNYTGKFVDIDFTT